MSVNPYESSKVEGQPIAAHPNKWRSQLLSILVGVGILGLLILMLLPNVRGAREATRRSSCSNNLKQIGIALHNYADEYGSLPPAYTVDAEGKPLHSWRTLILPFIEQKSLYDTIDLSKPWDDPANQHARDTHIGVYACPSATIERGQTTYLVIVGPTSCLQAAEPRKLDEIADGVGQTLIVLEADYSRAVHWMSPTDMSEQDAVRFADAERLPHPNGAQGLFADGSIRFLSKDSKPETIRAMISIAGGDDVPAD